MVLYGNDQVERRLSDIVRWGPVVAGALIGLAVFVLLDTLWLASAASGSGGWVRDNLTGLLVVSAAFALLLTGFVAGNCAGVSGAWAGLANGVTAWGLLLVLAATAVVPRLANPAAALGVGTGAAMPGGLAVVDALWALFWSLLVGLVVAAVGGLIGGSLRRGGNRKSAPRGGRATSPAGTRVVVPEQRSAEATDGAFVPEQRSAEATGGSQRAR